MKKILKWVLIALLVILIAFIGFVAIVGIQFMSYYSNDDVYADITLLREGDIAVGDVVPMVLVVPEEFSDLHKEWWECYVKEGETLESRSEYVLERYAIEENYSPEQVKDMFAQSPISIESHDPENSMYTERIAVFIPEEPGVYVISILGYYRSTSPSGYGGIEVVVHEE